MGSVVDGLEAALAVSDVEKAVVKATRHKLGPPKVKHVKYLISYVQGWGANYSELFRFFRQRIREKDWVVAFKVLIVIHELIREGSERFCEAFLSHASVLNLQSFRDKGSGSQGAQQSANIRAYSQYLEERVIAIRQLGHDFFRDVKSTSSRLRTDRVTPAFLNDIEALLKLVQALLGCKFYLDDIDNPVTFECFKLLLKDLLKVYQIMNEGVVNILQQFFDLPKPIAKDCLDVYKKFAKQSEEVNRFLTIAKGLAPVLGIDPPELRMAPASLAKDLEAYLNNSAGNATSSSPVSPNPPQQQQSAFFRSNNDGFVPTSTVAAPAAYAAAPSSQESLAIEPPKRATQQPASSRRREPSSPSRPMTVAAPQGLVDPFDDFLNENIKVASPTAPSPQQGGPTPFGAPTTYGGSVGLQQQQRPVTSYNPFQSQPAASANPFASSAAAPVAVDPFASARPAQFGTSTASFADPFVSTSVSQGRPAASGAASMVDPFASAAPVAARADPFASLQQPIAAPAADPFALKKAEVLRAQNSAASGMVPYGMTPQQQGMMMMSHSNGSGLMMSHPNGSGHLMSHPNGSGGLIAPYGMQQQQQLQLQQQQQLQLQQQQQALYYQQQQLLQQQQQQQQNLNPFAQQTRPTSMWG